MATKPAKRFEAEFAKEKAKNPKVSYEQFLESKASIMESAICQIYGDMDELHGVIWMLKKELDQPKEDVNLYQARKVLDAIFSLSIKQQCDLMEYSDLDY